MTQTNRQSPTNHPAAKLASRATTKGGPEFMTGPSDQAKHRQEKVLDLGRESTEHFARSADAAAKVLYETIELSSRAINTGMECGGVTATLAKDMGSELSACANKALADTIGHAKGLCGCRTIGDMFELQTRIVESTIDTFFTHSAKLSDMMFEYSSAVLEPIHNRVADATEKLTKALEP